MNVQFLAAILTAFLALAGLLIVSIFASRKRI